jgi:DNA-binding transcriptional MerR regulator
MRQLMLGEKVYELAPITYGMQKRLMAHLQDEAITEWLRRARAAGLPFDQIKPELDRLNKREEIEMQTPESVAYMLWLRVEHSGVPLEEIYALPHEYLLLNQEEIAESDAMLSESDKKKLEAMRKEAEEELKKKKDSPTSSASTPPC